MPVLVVNRQTRWIWLHLFHLFHLWRYNPFQALASFIRRLHSSLFAALLLHPLIPTSFRASLWTTSAHLVLGLPTGQAYILLTERARIVVLQSCIMFENSMYQRSIPFPCSQVVVCLSIPSEAFLRFSEHSFFFRGGVVTPTPNPQLGGPGCHFLSGPSPLTCPAWVTLPVTTQPPA